MQIFGFWGRALPEIVIFFARGNSLSQNLTVWMESFCLPSACKDAPLGQRQGGVFRVPPPYLWTPPTPQRAKGYTPLTILKKKSKHKKASAAPVGAIALTLFSLLYLKPLSRCATAPPRGSGHAGSAAEAISNRLVPKQKLPPCGVQSGRGEFFGDYSANSGVDR